MTLPPESEAGWNIADGPWTPPAEAASVAVVQSRSWFDWAAAQIDASLTNDRMACDLLLASLEEMRRSAQIWAETEPAIGEAVRQKMSAVIIAVQSHDRLVQQLTHVVESLRAVQDHLADAPRLQSVESWRQLRDRQLRCFSMAEERLLFARIVGADDGPNHASLDLEQAVEMFGADPVFDEPSS